MDTAVLEAPRPVGAPSGVGLPDPLPVVRETVHGLLTASPAYHQLTEQDQRALAHDMVRVCHTAALLIREEADSSRAVDEAMGLSPHDPPAPLATAQSAGSDFSGVAANRAVAVTQNTLNAVSFPRFVSELITGVFKAISDSGMQQMSAYLELLNGVAASIEGFDSTAMSDDRARSWLVEHFPDSFEASDGGEDADPEEPRTATVQLRSGGHPPSDEAVRAALGLGPEESVPSGDPERTLVPLARRKLAKNRQEMLATMVMMGMQRIVIDSGKINASMRFHIDTRSAAQDDSASSFEFRNQTNASANVGIGAWGVKADVQNTIAYVSTDRTQTTEEMNTSLDLNSSVEVLFKSDYLPLNRLASNDQVDRIRQNSRNPEAEDAAAATERTERARINAGSDQSRRASMDSILRPPTPPPTGSQSTAAPPHTGAQPPAAGAQPPAAGAQPPAAGAQPPAAGAQPPAAGAQPPAAGAQPPAAGARPPAGGAQPPAAGAGTTPHP